MLIKMIEMFFLSALVIPKIIGRFEGLLVSVQRHLPPNVQPYLTLNVSLWYLLSRGKCNSGRQ